MLGNCEKMAVISSTTSQEWPQIDEKGLMDSSTKAMEKPNQDEYHLQQQQQPLKCPRCDSSNTKFCYYNNYSLSQPRHFCKACKRYWTRGGTLRNVPVGGGCRKNKRVKRPALASDANSSSSAQQTVTSNPSVVPPGQIDLSSPTPNHVNSLFYNLLINHPSELNLPYPRFNSRVSSMDSVNGYDLQSHMNGSLGLGFSSGLLASDVTNKQIQDDAVPCNSLLSSYNPIFGSTSTSTVASLIASSLNQQKFFFSGLKDAQEGNNFQGFEHFEDTQMPQRSSEGSLMVKDVKMEEGHNSLDWIGVANNSNNNENHINRINSSDPSLLWNTNGIGAWLDPSNVGSSVPSLI